ncbi:SpoIIE family protein phosphatase [Kitasatospora sp. NPDC059577]|uniref:SpoIIE family protein phosphatase n=1 Tax=unclassified Kitasatospora TaxID=2633591 RepID=UPI0036902B80
MSSNLARRLPTGDGSGPRIGGIPLGAIDQAAYEEHEARLETGDTLVMSTDGLVERREPFSGPRREGAGAGPPGPGGRASRGGRTARTPRRSRWRVRR